MYFQGHPALLERCTLWSVRALCCSGLGPVVFAPAAHISTVVFQRSGCVLLISCQSDNVSLSGGRWYILVNVFCHGPKKRIARTQTEREALFCSTPPSRPDPRVISADPLCTESAPFHREGDSQPGACIHTLSACTHTPDCKHMQSEALHASTHCLTPTKCLLFSGGVGGGIGATQPHCLTVSTILSEVTLELRE